MNWVVLLSLSYWTFKQPETIVFSNVVRNVDVEVFEIGPSMSFVEWVGLLKWYPREESGIYCDGEWELVNIGDMNI